MPKVQGARSARCVIKFMSSFAWVQIVLCIVLCTVTKKKDARGLHTGIHFVQTDKKLFISAAYTLAHMAERSKA